MRLMGPPHRPGDDPTSYVIAAGTDILSPAQAPNPHHISQERVAGFSPLVAIETV
jgi:hypothetical protein